MKFALHGIAGRLVSLPTRTLSWDVFLYSEDPRPCSKDAHPPPLGTEAEIRARLAATLPDLEWMDENRGRCEIPEGILDLSYDAEQQGIIFILVELRGGPGVLAATVQLCRDHGWVAWRCDSRTLLNLASPANPSWEEYQTERARARTSSLRQRSCAVHRGRTTNLWAGMKLIAPFGWLMHAALAQTAHGIAIPFHVCQSNLPSLPGQPAITLWSTNSLPPTATR